MRSQGTHIIAAAIVLSLAGQMAFAQSKQYQRPKATAQPTDEAGKKLTPAKAGDAAKAATPQADSDKVDISDLEEKYWAPKDVDFSVVQNRTYAKAGRYSFSPMVGPLVNDTFNEGLNTSLKLNYYFDERTGVELSYTSTDAKDSETTKKFKDQLSGGAVQPDFNRDDSLISLGYNFVPIYAKMSLLGRRILYFDMQVTPWIGFANYEQVALPSTGKNGNKESSFAYGLDITQYFFVHKHFALRFDLHNRWYKHDILGYQSGNVVRSETANTTMFLLGFTYFH